MGVGAIEDEELIEFAVRFLLTDPQDARTLVHHLFRDWPDAQPLQLIYALSVAAGTVEHMLAGPDVSCRAQDVWRMTGLLGVDLYIMGLLGLPTQTAANMTAYWQAHDPFFIRQ